MNQSSEIKAAAAGQSLPLGELAKKVGLSPSSLSNIIAGRATHPKASIHLANIRRVLRLPKDSHAKGKKSKGSK